jgi:hypothetical protein
MLDGVMLLWFLLTTTALLFVAVDIRNTPESPVLKWGFVLLTAYTGVVGAFLYVLGCREPLPGLHERYVAIIGKAGLCRSGAGAAEWKGGWTDPEGSRPFLGALLAGLLNPKRPIGIRRPRWRWN